MTPIIDEALCIGCGNCANICPTVFILDEEAGKARVFDPEGCDFSDCCEAAEENCPVEAITLNG